MGLFHAPVLLSKKVLKLKDLSQKFPNFLGSQSSWCLGDFSQNPRAKEKPDCKLKIW
jgi:hypothetical protein